MIIAFPSFKLLYLLDEVISPSMTIKVAGLLNIGQKSIYFELLNNYQLLLVSFSLKHINQTKINNINIKFDKFKEPFHSYCRSINRIGPHNIDVISVICGLLLGDGYANKRSGEGITLAIKQSIIHKDYLFFLYNFLYSRGYCSNLLPREYTRTLKTTNIIYKGYEFNTYTFRSFN
jgi:hypothetical protein